MAGFFRQRSRTGLACTKPHSSIQRASRRGSSRSRIAELVRTHKADFQATVTTLVIEAGGPAALGAQLAILAEVASRVHGENEEQAILEIALDDEATRWWAREQVRQTQGYYTGEQVRLRQTGVKDGVVITPRRTGVHEK